MKAINSKRNSKNEVTVVKIDHQNHGKKNRNSCVEWCQLIATICIPVIITIYTIIQHRQDLHKADMDRTSELQIAEDNRLNEFLIAAHNRQKDRDLAQDQQWENILVEYHRFLSGLFAKRGSLSFTDQDKRLLLLMTHTTLNQLNTKRKRYVIRSLYEAKLITLKVTDDPFKPSFLELEAVDLRNVTFGSVHDSKIRQGVSYLIDWNYLYLPRAIFTNASFRHAKLSCATLFNTNFDSADLSFADNREPQCFRKKTNFSTTFKGSSFVNASLNHVYFTNVTFYGSNFTFANMYNFKCFDCDFEKSILVRVDLSHSNIHCTDYQKASYNFHSTDLSYATAHMTSFISINSHYSDWSHVQATQIRFTSCTFANTTMINASFVKATITQSSFQQTNLSYVDLSYAILTNVTFVNTTMQHVNFNYIKCKYCNFTNVDLRNSIWRNASLHYSNFVNCFINENQLEETIDLSGSKLPNGTIVQNVDLIDILLKY